MSLQAKIEEKLNQSLKNKDKNLYPTLRLIVSGIKDAIIANRTKNSKQLTDQDIVSILKKMLKQRKESSDLYKKAGRTELLESENKEIEIINSFLPKQITAALVWLFGFETHPLSFFLSRYRYAPPSTIIEVSSHK